MFPRLLSKPLEIGQSFFLFGPRGTGKSTWLNTVFSDAETVRVDLLKSDLYTDLLARPQRIESLIPPGFSGWVVIDEVQRVPMLLNEVHRLIETRAIRFALTGSSTRKLRRGGVNLLAGRALTYHMPPLLAAEMKDSFSLERAIRFGELPFVASAPDPEGYLKAYIAAYLREEVFQEGLVRNLANFSRFLETASFSQGSSLNLAVVAREAALNRNVVENYFAILEDLLIAFRLPVFTRRAQRRLIAHPKFYFFDSGVYRAIRPSGPLDTPEESEGAALETLCFQELRGVNDVLGFGYDLFYWRTSDGMEVDFVLYGSRGLVAVEVKRCKHPSRHDLSGLRSFRKDYPLAACHLVCGCAQRAYEDGMFLWPAAEFLSRLPEILGKPDLPHG